MELERWGEIGRTFARERAELEHAMYRAAGTEFNINSTPQLRHVLFEKIQLPAQKKTKTGPSTDFEVLEQLAGQGHEVPRLLIEYRELSKLKSTYIDALPGFINPKTGRIHTSFNQTGAATGRLSSSDPNLQNIPVRTRRGEAIRRAFVAAPGALLLTADYSQIELRLLEGVPEGGGHPPPDTRAHLQRAAGPGDTREARAREDHQLRHDLRPGAVRPIAPARHLAGGRPRLHSGVLHPLRRRAGLARSHRRRGAAAGLCRDPVRTTALHPGAQGSQLQYPRLR